MDNRNYILQELSEISPLLTKINNKEVYSVPSSYFTNLADAVLNQINSVEEAHFSFTKSNPMKAPDGYFENFSMLVLQRIEKEQSQLSEVEQELNEIAPFLNRIDKRPVYAVPDGFFQQFKVEHPGADYLESKVVSLNAGRRIWRYAAAAVITTLIAVSAYLFIDKESETKHSSSTANISSQVKTLSDEEIVNYLEAHSNSRNVTKVYFEGTKQDTELNKRLKQMSDEEIKQYLKENSEPGESEIDI